MLFATPCFQVLTTIAYDCTIQDLAFQVLNPFGVNSFKSIYVFHDLVCQDLNTSENDCQELACTVEDLACQVLKCYFVLQIHVLKSWQSFHCFWGSKFQN